MLKSYFKNYGPSSLKDVAHWSGMSQKEFMSSFLNIQKELDEYSYENKKLYLLKDDIDFQQKVSEQKSVMLLGQFDPLFVCYNDKAWIADEKQQKEIWRNAAIGESDFLVD